MILYIIYNSSERQQMGGVDNQQGASEEISADTPSIYCGYQREFKIGTQDKQWPYKYRICFVGVENR